MLSMSHFKLVSLTILGIIIMSLNVQTLSAYKWEQRISLNMVTSSNSGGVWLPTENNSAGMGEIDITKYSNISEIYFETIAEYDFTGIPNSIGNCDSRLYDATNNREINESERPMAAGAQVLVRSKNLTYIFNQTSPMIIMTQTKAGAESICFLHHGNLVIVQNGKISKTRTMIPMGSSLTQSDGCENPEEVSSEPKYWNYSSNDFVSTNITFAATLTSTGATSRARAFITNSTTNLASLTSDVLAIDFRYYNSTNLNNNFSNSLLTVSLCKFLGLDSGFMRNAFIVVDQNGIDTTNPKTVTMYQLDVDIRSTTNTIPTDNDNQSEFFNQTQWDIVNLNPLADYVVINTNQSATIFANVKKGTKRIPESNVSINAINFTYLKSQTFSELYFLKHDYLQAEIWANTSGSSSLSSARVIFYINGFRCWYYDAVNDKLVLNSGCRLPMPSGAISFF